MPKRIEEIQQEPTIWDQLKDLNFPDKFGRVVELAIKGVTGKEVIFKFHGQGESDQLSDETHQKTTTKENSVT